MPHIILLTLKLVPEPSLRQLIAAKDAEYSLLMGITEVVNGASLLTSKGHMLRAVQQSAVCPGGTPPPLFPYRVL